MAATTMPPLLTNITTDQLECTLHCPDYQCLFKLWSCIGGGAKSSSHKNNINDNDAKRISSTPVISSIGVIPIVASNNRDVNSESKIIHLLPTLRDNGDEIVWAGSCHHPCHELIRISHAMQAQLKERLQDASDGALENDLEAHSNGTMENFLLRCEAVFRELLSAVQMLKRRDEGSTSLQRNNSKIVGDAGGGGIKKRGHGSIASSSSSIATQPPPLEYYYALLRQLHTLQHIPNVTDISLHKDNSSSNNNSKNNANGNTAKDLTRVSITCQDIQKRVHTWHAELYPTIVLTVDLPNEFVLDDIVQGMNNMNVNKWWVHSGDNSDDEDDIDNNNKANGAPSSSSSSLSPYHQQLLPRIQQHFEKTLNSHQKLFDELDDIDSNLWILEPTLPARRSCVERRIALWEGGASIVIVLDHEKPRGIPIMVRFLGVTTAMINAVGGHGGGNGVVGSVADWRASFADFVAQDETMTEEDGKKRKRATDDVSKANISNDEKKKNSNNNDNNKKRWSEERSIRENLELWLGSPLPSPLSTEKSDYLVECGICYAHRLPILTNEDDTDTTINDEEGPLPEEKCSNPSCNRYYHESCLFEWLHSLPTARVSFDRIFGTCPYCCEGVSVKVLNQVQH